MKTNNAMQEYSTGSLVLETQRLSVTNGPGVQLDGFSYIWKADLSFVFLVKTLNEK